MKAKMNIKLFYGLVFCVFSTSATAGGAIDCPQFEYAELKDMQTKQLKEDYCDYKEAEGIDQDFLATMAGHGVDDDYLTEARINTAHCTVVIRQITTVLKTRSIKSPACPAKK